MSEQLASGSTGRGTIPWRCWEFLVLGAVVYGACRALLLAESVAGGESGRSVVDLAVVLLLVLFLYRRSRFLTKRLKFGVFICAVMAGHLTLNALAAKVTLGLIWGVNSSIYDSVSLAQSIVVCGFLATWISYLYFSRRAITADALGRYVRLLSASNDALHKRARLLCLLGSVLIFLMLLALGYMPLLRDNPLAARINGSSGSPLLFAALNKLIVVVSLAAPVLLLGRRVSWRSVTLFLFALGTVALTASRERTFFMLLFAPASLLVFRKRSFLVLVSIAPIVFLAFFLTDSFLKAGNELEARSVTEVAGTVLPEMRDLGWTLNLWDGPALYGRTYVADLLPLPSALFPFKNEFTTAGITREAVGVGDDAPNFSLRITGYGEAWLNFGFLGVALFGVLLGRLIHSGEIFLAVASMRSPEHFYGAAAVVLVPILYLYLAGTAVFWDTALLPFVVIWVLFRTRSAPRKSEAFDTSKSALRIAPAG